MSYDLWVLLFAVVGFTSCMMLNLSVVFVYVKDWWAGRRLLAFDQILFSTAVSSVLLQFSILMDSVLYYSQMYVVISEVVMMKWNLCNTTVFFFLLELHFWQTALLSIYYCAKLVNFSYCFSAWLKMKIQASPGQLVLILGVILIVLALPLMWTIKVKKENRTHGTQQEVSMNNPYNVFNMVIGCCLPFTVTLTCIGLSVQSLVSHVWRIKQNISESSSSPQIRAHVRASTTMVLCAAVNLSLIFNAVFLFQTKLYMGTRLHFIFWFIFMTHPTIHIIVLIAGNSKLKSQLQIKCR